MAFRKYTQCYVHTAGDRPFNIDGLAGLAILHGVVPAVLFGALTGLAVGLMVGGPIGGIVGAVVGIFSGVTVGVSLALTRASQEWRFHRLVCLSGVRCAIGTVREQPTRGDLGQFDNDAFFDLQLMPHPLGTRVDPQPPGPTPGDTVKYSYDYKELSDNYKATPPAPGVVYGAAEQAHIGKHPRNDVLIDGLQGSDLVRPSIGDLPYDTRFNWLHCEAEGDFWVRMSDLASALGLLVALLATVTAVAGYAGAAAGASYGCTIGGIFGPIGCLIGAILGAILGALLAGGATALAGKAIVEAALQAVFDVDPGDVEDANVGDAALGPIRAGDRVAVLGEHVYDGFHEGWHELHPLMAVVKLADRRFGDESRYYLEWSPDFAEGAPLPDDLPGMPSGPADDITRLSPDDMRKGLESEKFARRVDWLRKRWCELLREPFDGAVRTRQQSLAERWTIHPLVDGCRPR